jgi:Uma2 family endonuclease
MNAPHRLRMTGEEFLAWEAGQEHKHELVDGVVRMMAGGTVAHEAIAVNVVTVLKPRLRGGPCRVFGAGLKVRTRGASFRYPNATIDCGEAGPRALFADKPTDLFKVLSPSTEWFDATDKLAEFQQIVSVRHIVLLSQTRAFGRVWTRTQAGWATMDVDGLEAKIALPGLSLSLPMAEVYDGVTFSVAGE